VSSGDERSRIGPYVLERELGRGGMGVVWAAWCPELRRRVAVKRLLPTATDASTLLRFGREARAAAQLRHPGIVGVLHAGLDQGAPFIAMDFIEGPTLAQRLRERGPLAPREAARLVERLARAVAHAHGHGVIHRDIKPQNVFLVGEEPVLGDFGLARVEQEAARRLTATGELLGTPGFMAPEQADGGEVDARADVFALGATLYAALTGSAPFHGSAIQILAQLLTRAPDPPSTKVPGLDPALDAIVARCLRLAPAERPPSAAALADLLAAWLGSRPARSRSSRLPRAALFPLGAAAALLVLGGALLGALAVTRASPPPPPPAVVVAAPPPVPVAFAAASVALASSAPASVAATVKAAADQDAVPWVRVAVAREAAGDTRGALAACDRALAVDPTCLRAWQKRAQLRRRVGDCPGAIADGDAALALQPDDPTTLSNRGLARWSAGDLDGALVDLDRAVAVAPERVGSWSNRGALRVQKDDLAGAKEDLDRALTLDPTFVAALRSRAETHRRLGDLVRAREDLVRARDLSTGPERERVVQALATLEASTAAAR